MENHGTPYPCTIGQLATISANVTVALPRAMRLSGLDAKTILKYTDEEGERLSMALAEAFKMLYNGHASTVALPHIIDCDSALFVPDGWKVEEHDEGGQLTFDASKIELYFSVAQDQTKGSIGGNELRKELADKPVLNANVLDYLLANPHLIPKEWKGKSIFFWGTIYRDSDGLLCVRCLCWGGNGWRWGRYWLDGGWRRGTIGRGLSGGGPAALRVS
ncbi:MAG: hypothetical protein ACHQU0_01675 [Candidatus Paceibacteria bacterium]